MRKRTIEIVVVSDLYLGNEACKAQELLTYLSSIKPSILVLNGGLVSGAGSGLYELPKIQLKIVKKIVAMAAQGTEVYVLAGDDDHYLNKLGGIVIGTIHIQKELVLNLDNKQTWFLHGQLFDMGKKSSLLLKPMGRFSYPLLAKWNQLKGSFRSLSQKRNHATDLGMSTDRNSVKFRENAISYANQKGYDSVACGHTGHPEKFMEEGESGKTLYLNSGNWTTQMTALEYAFKRWKVYKYQADKCSAFYADEELKTLDLRDIKALLDKPGKPGQDKGLMRFLQKRVS